jgi:hypothetical protein
MKLALLILISLYVSGCTTHGWDRADIYDQNAKQALLTQDKKQCMLANKSASVYSNMRHFNSGQTFTLDGRPLDDEMLEDYSIDPDDSMFDIVGAHDNVNGPDLVSECIEDKGWAWVPKDQIDQQALVNNL